MAQYLPGTTGVLIGPYEVNVYAACTLVFALAMVLTLNRRLLRDSAEKERMASEPEAARTAQSLMLPSAALASGAYDIQAVYNPAQEVGGDFYHVLDDNVLVVGDVSGKGLRAAMLVLLLLGVLRETREREPGAVLSVMNRALSGSSGGTFVTCCCVRLGPEGLLTVASAGHPAPWLDGVEAELSPGLPLGIDPEAVYEERTFLLRPDGQLALVSDGVVEAANGSRELFGFERAAAIATKPAPHIADQARAWGQNDDITVVTVRRAAA
jgi:serine phosphatase RsbU (regulator of sigma subunit)